MKKHGTFDEVLERDLSGKNLSAAKKKSKARNKTQAGKYWMKVFTDMGVSSRMSGMLSSFLLQIPIKNRKQLGEWLDSSKLGGVLGIRNMGPAKLKYLTQAAADSAGAPETNGTKDEYLGNQLNVGQTIKLTQEQGVDESVRVKGDKFKGRSTVVLYNDRGIIMSFGRRKAQAILAVIDDPVAMKVIKEVAAGKRDVLAAEPHDQLHSDMIKRGVTPHPSTYLTDDGMGVITDLFSAVVSHLDVQTEMGKEFVMVALECIELFEKKQRDYGSANISMVGCAGLACRLIDKACRLQNLIQKRERDGQPPENETIEDSFLDSACLGMIGILVTRGFWK